MRCKVFGKKHFTFPGRMGIIKNAGSGRQVSLPVALPDLREDVSEWTKPQDAYNGDVEEQDLEEQLLEDVEPEQMSMKEASLELIEKALQKHGGNRKAAAKELGISERTIYRKLDLLKKKK